jgi:hypothetical protein
MWQSLQLLTPLSLIYSYRPLFSFAGVKVSLHFNFVLNFLNRMFLSHSGNLLNTCSDMSQRPSFQSSLVSFVVSCTFRAILHQNRLSIIYYILFLTQSSVVAAGMVFFLQKVMFLTGIFILFCIEQSVIICWFSATLLSSELQYSQ